MFEYTENKETTCISVAHKAPSGLQTDSLRSCDLPRILLCNSNLNLSLIKYATEITVINKPVVQMIVIITYEMIRAMINWSSPVFVSSVVQLHGPRLLNLHAQ